MRGPETGGIAAVGANHSPPTAADGRPMPNADPTEAVAEAIGRVRRDPRLRRFALALDFSQARRDVREILDGRHMLFRQCVTSIFLTNEGRL